MTYIHISGIHVAVLIVALVGILSAIGANKAPDCSLTVSPQLALAPLADLRVRTVIEPVADWRAARVTLFSDSGEVTASDVQLDKRTKEFTWHHLALEAGDYYLHLQVAGQGGARCDAKATLEVHGEQ